MTITENQAKDIFMYIASILKCNDVAFIRTRLMMRYNVTTVWLSVFLVNDDGKYHFAFGHDYVSMLNKIIKFKYLVVGDMVYKIPRSLEELFIEMDLNG